MTEDEIARVLTHYDLGALQACRPVGRGYVNDNWLVETTTGRYFLKRRHPSLRKPHLIHAQHALVQHLRRVRFPAPAILPTRQRTTFLELQHKIYEIHAYISGDLCEITRPAHFAAAARTLGWYHNAVRGFDHPVFHQPRERYGPTVLARTIDWLMEIWQEPASPQLDRLIAELRQHAQDLAGRFSELGPLRELVIHGDYYAENLIFHGDMVAGVVDYDLAHWSWQAMELAEALIYFAAERPGHLRHVVYPGVLDLDAVERFLAAYAETVTLQEAEIRALPHLVRTIWLCASLNPPLRPPLGLEEAPQALPEVLTLARWAEGHAADIVEIGLVARAKRTA